MIGSVRADWPAPFSVTIRNPRADKLGRNGIECIGRRCLVDRERCVRATFMHSAIENYSMLHLQRWLECRGIKRFGTKSLFMIISHNCQSCMCRQYLICYKIGIYSIKYVVMLHKQTVIGSKIHPRELSYKRNQKVGETQFRIQLQLRIVCHSLFIIK